MIEEKDNRLIENLVVMNEARKRIEEKNKEIDNFKKNNRRAK